MTTLCAVSDNTFPKEKSYFFSVSASFCRYYVKLRKTVECLFLGLVLAVAFPLPKLSGEQLSLPFPELVPLQSSLRDTGDFSAITPPQGQESSTRATSRFVGRILHHLFEQEARQTNPHHRSDLRIAWLLVYYHHHQRPDAELLAWRAVLNCRPEEVWPSILENRRQRLGAEFAEWYTPEGLLKPESAFNGASSPKKPPKTRSERDPQRQRRTA